jgi:hypothetical protein
MVKENNKKYTSKKYNITYIKLLSIAFDSDEIISREMRKVSKILNSSIHFSKKNLILRNFENFKKKESGHIIKFNEHQHLEPVIIENIELNKNWNKEEWLDYLYKTIQNEELESL